ncbi:MAG TPA: hypothetical protein VM487_11550 [Phycisphaerae bacterium]|nr:hypothetical protein [Phycisphaerae bacterium]
MPSKINLRFVGLALPAGLCLILLMGTSCPGLTPPPPPPPPPPTTLVNESFGFVPPIRNFNPSAAGRTITATVSGNATGSRITVLVTDLATGSVVAAQLLPTTNTTTVTFTSTNNGAHAVTSAEVGAGSATYTILVTEQ